MTAQPIVIQFSALLEQPSTVGSKLEEALGSKDGSLGIVVIDGECLAQLRPCVLITGLPASFPALREKMFILAEKLASSDPDTLEREYTKPDTSYLFGWSHGKEVMNGVC